FRRGFFSELFFNIVEDDVSPTHYQLSAYSVANSLPCSGHYGYFPFKCLLFHVVDSTFLPVFVVALYTFLFLKGKIGLFLKSAARLFVCAVDKSFLRCFCCGYVRYYPAVERKTISLYFSIHIASCKNRRNSHRLFWRQ